VFLTPQAHDNQPDTSRDCGLGYFLRSDPIAITGSVWIDPRILDVSRWLAVNPLTCGSDIRKVCSDEPAWKMA
jgi:hypothetical protein